MATVPMARPAGSLKETLQALALRYPEPVRKAQLADVDRIAFHIALAQELAEVDRPVVADIGGGIGLFSIGCAALGMDVTLVDDFSDEVNRLHSRSSALALHDEVGVTVQSCDVMKDFSLPHNQFDVIASFDCMEHLHNSPKKLFHGLIDSLRAGGWFILGVPNCVNLRKRITVPLGKGKWTRMESWYEVDVFRGHVREPDVDDLRYIARDLGLKEVKVMGRNWLGYARRGMRAVMPAIDLALRPFPSLCANIYLIGRK